MQSFTCLPGGKRVGVSSHSHTAINNVLHAVEAAATDRGVRANETGFAEIKCANSGAASDAPRRRRSESTLFGVGRAELFLGHLEPW
jgi:hypothetical protein